MKEIWNIIYKFYTGWLHPTFDSSVTFFVNHSYGVYILLALVVALSIVKKKIDPRSSVRPEDGSKDRPTGASHGTPSAGERKARAWAGIIDFIVGIIIIFLIIIAYNSFKPAISKFFKSSTATKSSIPTKKSSTPTKSTPSTQSAPTNQSTPSYTAPTYTAPKQLFYSVSCSSCWSEGCPNNGYYYSGYDAGSYSYYYALCQACSCNSLVGHSFWK